jgi:hypothetical protein
MLTEDEKKHEKTHSAQPVIKSDNEAQNPRDERHED